MLIDHDNLGEFRDPANYDLEEGRGNEPRITFYGSLIHEFGEPALEVACGTGLVTISLAQQGFDALHGLLGEGRVIDHGGIAAHELKGVTRPRGLADASDHALQALR